MLNTKIEPRVIVEAVIIRIDGNSVNIALPATDTSKYSGVYEIEVKLKYANNEVQSIATGSITFEESILPVIEDNI